MTATWCVYQLDWRHCGGPVYVGSAMDLNARLKTHRQQPARSLVEAWKLGEPEVAVIVDGLSNSEAQRRERAEIVTRGALGNTGGRPPKTDGPRVTIGITLSRELHARLREAADARGHGVSTLIRAILMEWEEAR